MRVRLFFLLTLHVVNVHDVGASGPSQSAAPSGESRKYTGSDVPPARRTRLHEAALQQRRGLIKYVCLRPARPVSRSLLSPKIATTREAVRLRHGGRSGRGGGGRDERVPLGRAFVPRSLKSAPFPISHAAMSSESATAADALVRRRPQGPRASC